MFPSFLNLDQPLHRWPFAQLTEEAILYVQIHCVYGLPCPAHQTFDEKDCLKVSRLRLGSHSLLLMVEQ